MFETNKPSEARTSPQFIIFLISPKDILMGLSQIPRRPFSILPFSAPRQAPFQCLFLVFIDGTRYTLVAFFCGHMHFS